ncbi:MAG TPA: M14 family zinc carboxypeptidase [Candidatus Anammoximicrobium sp.]|nr:M14 family zinc carboxypeptidase [Candidatus Anammoximicrobium sp.]
MTRYRFLTVLFGAGLVCSLVDAAIAGETPQIPAAQPHPLHYISTEFENASPLWWEIQEDGTVQVQLVYDQERSSPNRANGHWLFRVEAEPGCDLTLVLGPFANVWNGVLGKPTPEATISFISDDGKQWRAIPAEPAEPYRLKLRVHLEGSSLYVARLEPYRLSDLEKLKADIAGQPLVEITPIGRTVEDRELEIIRVGKPDAPHRVFIRARAHPWEPGGNWVVEGLIRRLLQGDDDARRYLDRYCLYVMPMANKDGVARGRTRFNPRGMDLNRKWDQPADPALAPENAALEKWIETMIAQGKTPNLAIDFHNDAGGRLHVSRPEGEASGLQEYLARMERLEKLLREKTWFTEGSTKASFRNPGTIGEGMLARYGIVACVHELNANHIAGLNDHPTAENWRKYGRQLAEVFCEYFGSE